MAKLTDISRTNDQSTELTSRSGAIRHEGAVLREVALETSLSRARLALYDTDLEHLELQEAKRIRSMILGRVLMCLMATILMWMSSLLVIDPIVDYLLPSVHSQTLSHSWRGLIDAATSEITQYQSCLQQEHNTCLSSLTSAGDELHASLIQNEDVVNKTVALAVSKQDTCQAAYMQVSHAFLTHQRYGGSIFINHMCAPSERLITSGLVQSEAGAVVGRVMSSVQELSTDIQSTLQDFRHHFASRAAYDVDYVLGKSVTLRHIHGEFTLYPIEKVKKLGTLFLPVFSKLDELTCKDGCQSILFDQIDDVVGKYNSMLIQLARQHVFMQGIVSKFVDQFASLDAGITIIADIQSVFNFFPTFVGFPKTNSYSIPRFPYVPLLDIDLIPRVNTDDVYAKIKQSLAQVMEVFSRRLNDVRSRFSIALSNVEAKISNLYIDLPILDGYDPPLISFPSVVVPQMDYAQFEPIFRNITLSDIKNIALNRSETIIFSSISLNTTSIGFDSSNSVLLQKAISVDSITSVFDNLFWFMTICDIVYRCCSSLRILSSYFSKSAVGIPTLDISKADAEEKNTSLILKLPLMLIRPLIAAAIAIVFVLVTFQYIVKYYLVLYDDYLKGCVATQDGTSISRLITSVLTTLITSQIAPLKSSYDSSYLGRWNGVCSSISSPFVTRSVHSSQSYLEARRSYENSFHNLGYILKCIDIATFSSESSTLLGSGRFTRDTIASVQENECTLTAFPSLTPTDDFYARCSALLPNCALACTPPDSSLSDIATRTSCVTEWFLHSNILRCVLTIVLLICLNVSRVSIIHFVSTNYWESLTAGKVLVKSDCDSQGSKLPLQDRDTRVQLLASTIKRNKTIASVRLCLVLLVNIPSMYLLYYLRNFGEPL